MPDSKRFGVGGKMRQTSVRRLRCPNKSASGDHLNQNVPRPPAVDDRSACSPTSRWVTSHRGKRKRIRAFQKPLRSSRRKLLNQHTWKPLDSAFRNQMFLGDGLCKPQEKSKQGSKSRFFPNWEANLGKVQHRN